MFSVGVLVSIDDYSHTKYDLMWISSTSHDGPDYNMNLALIILFYLKYYSPALTACLHDLAHQVPQLKKSIQGLCQMKT